LLLLSFAFLLKNKRRTNTEKSFRNEAGLSVGPLLEGEYGDEEYQYGAEYQFGNHQLKIDYEENAGEVTTKTISVWMCWTDRAEKEAMLYAICHDTNECLHIYTNRIRKCVDLETGYSIHSVIEFLKTKKEDWYEVGIICKTGRDDGRTHRRK